MSGVSIHGAQLMNPQALPVVLEDADAGVVVKVMRTDGRECRIVEQLLGLRPWPEARSGRRQWSGVKRLWEALHLVPLAYDGVLRLGDHHEASALVMWKLQPLTRLSQLTTDPRMLLRSTAQMVEVWR